jgi:hypothetical protein
MTGTPETDHTKAVSKRDIEAAEATAGRSGLPGFCAWRVGLERRYTTMPRWYWDEQACRRHYIAHIQAATRWQERQGRISRGNADFHRSLTRHI